MKKKDIIKELKRIRDHMPDNTRCTAMVDELLASAQRGGGNGNGPPTGP